MQKIFKIVLIRHGESDFNKENRFCGWHDANLSEEGKADAVKISAAALLEHKMEFDYAYTSALKRSQQTLSIILKEIDCVDLPHKSDWRLNERHYGDLTGYNKRQMADRYGEEQVQIWRRKFDGRVPPIRMENPYYAGIRNNPSFSNIPAHKFPDGESLKMVMGRLIPFWEQILCEQVMRGKRVLIVAHGTVVRGLIKHMENISDEDISKVNMPNSIPCVCEFDAETNKFVRKVFLAEENFLNQAMEKTASIGK